MTDSMSKHERVQATLQNEPVDHPPATMWRHFFESESTTAGLIEAMVGFQKYFDWDFLKINERARFPAEDWGIELKWSGETTRPPELIRPAIENSTQWQEITPKNPLDGVMGKHLYALAKIVKELNGDIPTLMTVFSPISVTGALLADPSSLAVHIREEPQKIHTALTNVTETLCKFAVECLNAGADGIFLPTTIWGNQELLSQEEYEEFGRPYDLKVLQAVQEANFNVLHVCASNNRLLSLLDYPVHAFNWDDRDSTNPSLHEARSQTRKGLIGGIARHGVLQNGTPDDVIEEANDAQETSGGTGWFLGPTCAIPPDTPESNIWAALAAIRS